MPRSLLVTFNKDGSIYIDDAVYSVPEIQELHKYRGRAWVEVLIRIHHYRSPISPYLPMGERVEKAIVHTRRKHPTMTGNVTAVNHPTFVRAVEAYKELRYDPLLEEYVTLESKVDEMIQLLRETPVRETIEEIVFPAELKKGKPTKNIVDTILDAPSNDPKEPVRVKRTIDNSKQLGDWQKILSGYQKRLAELLPQIHSQVTSGGNSVVNKVSFKDFKDQ